MFLYVHDAYEIMEPNTINPKLMMPNYNHLIGIFHLT